MVNSFNISDVCKIVSLTQTDNDTLPIGCLVVIREKFGYLDSVNGNCYMVSDGVRGYIVYASQLDLAVNITAFD